MIDKEILEKILENDARSKENDAKVMIEQSKTNRWIVSVSIVAVCMVLVAWLLMPNEICVDVDNDSTSKSTIERVEK